MKRIQSVIILILFICPDQVNTWTRWVPVIMGKQRPETCLVLAFKPSGNPILRPIGCFTTLPAICETTSCKWCPHWNCRRTPYGCSKLIRGTPSWFHARAECMKLGGSMWVNSSYNPYDINWPDLKDSVKPKQEVWLGWRNLDWSYTQESDEIHPPRDFYLEESSTNTECVLQTVDQFRWTATLCNTAATAVCWRQGILDVTTTVGIPTTTNAANKTQRPSECAKITNYMIIFLVVAALCVIISVLSVTCCVRLAMRLRKYNLMRYNQEDKESFRKEDNGKGIIASIRRGARGLSQIYTEIFDIQGRTLPRTPSEQHYAVSRTPIKEATSENENESAQKPRSEIGVHLKQKPVDGLQYSAQATGSFKKGWASQVHGSPAYAKCKPKSRGDVSVYVKQKQTVGLCHDGPPSNFLPVLTETMTLEENPAYESSIA